MRIGRLARGSAALVLTACMTGCFEPPIREAVSLLFDAGGGVEVVVATRLEAESSYPNNPRARERIVEARDAARCGDDPFSRQLERLSPSSLRRALSWRDGALRESTRAATFTDARAVERLFEGAPLSVAVTRTGGDMQLEIYTGKGGRASTSERLEVARSLEGFSVASARYLRALAELWSWLDEHPDRERAVVAALLDVELEEAANEVRDEREEALGKAVTEAMAGVYEFLLLTGGRGESLDELSRMAYDPFPAPLTVEVKGAVVESTGFVPDDAGRMKVPEVSLWGALSGLSGRWVAPDPLAELVRRQERPEDGPPDVDAFLAGGRRVVARPDAREVRDAIEAALAPAPVYRLRWRLAKG